MIRVHSGDTEEAVNADVAALIYRLLQRQTVIREDLRRIELSKRAIQRLNHEINVQKFARRAHSGHGEPASGNRFHEPLVDLLGSLRQQRAELEEAECRLRINASKQRTDERNLFATVKSLENASLSGTTRKALRAVIEGQIPIMPQKKPLEKLHAD
jgi:hypothetical protein